MAYGKVSKNNHSHSSGKSFGAFTPEAFPGYKCLPKGHMSKSSGKLSGAHGLTKNTSPTKGMTNSSNRIGHRCRPFKSGISSKAGPISPKGKY